MVMNNRYESDLEGIDKKSWLAFQALFKGRKIATMPSLVATVATASTVVLAAKSDRKYAQIVNNSDSYVWLAFGEAAANDKGIPLVPKGGSFEINWYNLWVGSVTASAALDNKTVTTVEGW